MVTANHYIRNRDYLVLRERRQRRRNERNIKVLIKVAGSKVLEMRSISAGDLLLGRNVNMIVGIPVHPLLSSLHILM